MRSCSPAAKRSTRMASSPAIATSGKWRTQVDFVCSERANSWLCFEAPGRRDGVLEPDPTATHGRTPWVDQALLDTVRTAVICPTPLPETVSGSPRQVRRPCPLPPWAAWPRRPEVVEDRHYC